MAAIDISLTLNRTNTSWKESKSNFIYIGQTDDCVLYGQLWTRGRYNGSGIYEIESVKLGFSKTTRSSYYSGSVTKNSASGSATGFTTSYYSSTSGSSSYSIAGIPAYSSGTGIIALTYGSNGNGKISTTTTSYDSTKTAKITCNSSWLLATVDTSYGTDSSNISLTCTVNITVQGSYCVVVFKKDDGSTYSTKQGQYGDIIYCPSAYTKPSTSSSGSGAYTVSFNSNGGTAVASRSCNWSWTQSTSYSFDYWDGRVGNYSAGSAYSMTFNDTLTASFTSNPGEKNWRYSKLGALTYTYKKGYIKTNEWYYSNGALANSSDEIKSNTTLSVIWSPQVYRVSFNLNGGKMPEDFGKPSDYTFEKTYGVSQQLPQWEPTRVGYTFAGWSSADGSISPQGASASMDDRIYNSLYTEYTTGPVVLYAKWNLNPNTMIFNYYIINSQGIEIAYIGNNADRETYNVTQTKYQKYSPSHASEMTGDYVFLGWCDEKPSNWDNSEYENRGYHGIYTLPTDSPASELPVEVDISRLNKLEDWGGAPEQYYGIWTKTGKYIMINNSYKKVNTAYVKIAGSWKPITDIWVKTNNTWKHEI